MLQNMDIENVCSKCLKEDGSKLDFNLSLILSYATTREVQDTLQKIKAIINKQYILKHDIYLAVAYL